ALSHLKRNSAASHSAVAWLQLRVAFRPAGMEAKRWSWMSQSATVEKASARPAEALPPPVVLRKLSSPLSQSLSGRRPSTCFLRNALARLQPPRKWTRRFPQCDTQPRLAPARKCVPQAESLYDVISAPRTRNFSPP